MTSFSAWDLTEKEGQVLSVLLKAGKPVSVREIYGKLRVTRYYVYEILKRLKDLELVEELDEKPKKFLTSTTILRRKIQRMDAELNNHWTAFQTAPREEVFAELGLNDTERDILIALADAAPNQLTILEIRDRIGQSKSLVERYLKTLRSRKFVKRSRGLAQSYQYTIYPLQKIAETHTKQEQTEWGQKRGRLEEQIEAFSGGDKPQNFMDLSLRDLQGRVPRQNWLNILREIPATIKGVVEVSQRVPAHVSIDDGHVIF